MAREFNMNPNFAFLAQSIRADLTCPTATNRSMRLRDVAATWDGHGYRQAGRREVKGSGSGEEVKKARVKSRVPGSDWQSGNHGQKRMRFWWVWSRQSVPRVRLCRHVLPRRAGSPVHFIMRGGPALLATQSSAPCIAIPPLSPPPSFFLPMRIFFPPAEVPAVNRGTINLSLKPDKSYPGPLLGLKLCAVS